MSRKDKTELLDQVRMEKTRIDSAVLSHENSEKRIKFMIDFMYVSQKSIPYLVQRASRQTILDQLDENVLIAREHAVQWEIGLIKNLLQWHRSVIKPTLNQFDYPVVIALIDELLNKETYLAAIRTGVQNQRDSLNALITELDTYISPLLSEAKANEAKAIDMCANHAEASHTMQSIREMVDKKQRAIQTEVSRILESLPVELLCIRARAVLLDPSFKGTKTIVLSTHALTEYINVNQLHGLENVTEIRIERLPRTPLWEEWSGGLDYSEAIRSLIQYIVKKQCLTYMRITPPGPNFGDTAFGLLIEGLQTSTTLTMLEIESASLSPYLCDCIATFIRSKFITPTAGMTNLVISRCYLEDPGAKVITSAMRQLNHDYFTWNWDHVRHDHGKSVQTLKVWPINRH